MSLCITKRTLFSALLLQVAIVLIGIGALAFLLWEPHIEGRNAHATTFEMYFKDPFLAYVYVGSIPFFVALYQAFKVLGYIAQNKAFLQATAKALLTIKCCALTIIGFVAAGDALIASLSHIMHHWRCATALHRWRVSGMTKEENDSSQHGGVVCGLDSP